MRRLLLAIALGCASATAAAAQSAYPQVPGPSNPFPQNPIATDGSPLPRYAYSAEPTVDAPDPAVARPRSFDAFRPDR